MLPAQHQTVPISIPEAISSASHPGSNAQPNTDARLSFLDTAAFSPVNEKGCFEFDRVIKAGEILKRGRKTKVRNAKSFAPCAFY
jgi:hypothetical protein